MSTENNNNNQNVDLHKKRGLSSLPEEKQPLKKRRIIHCENPEAVEPSVKIGSTEISTDDTQQNLPIQSSLCDTISLSATDYQEIVPCVSGNQTVLENVILDYTGEILVSSLPSSQTSDILNCFIVPNSTVANVEITTIPTPSQIVQLQTVNSNNENDNNKTTYQKNTPIQTDTDTSVNNIQKDTVLVEESPISAGYSDASSATKSKRVRRKLVMSNQDNCPSSSSSSIGNSSLEVVEKRKIRRKKRPETLCTQEVGLDEMLNGMDGEIDHVLEETAQKNKLTSTNVKNILRHVITNEYVLSMVRNTMKIDEGKYDDMEEAAYEPKLTRSKAKELMEKQVTLPWPVSPLKISKVSNTKKLLEEEFSEDESSDEEYKPNNEALCHSEDEETSSLPSDIGSPSSYSIPGTPQTPMVPCDEPTDSNNVSITNDFSPQTDRIALRTRSKLPLNDTPLETIEASFFAPDITTDMYESECDDEEWNDFLSNFCKPLDSVVQSDNLEDDANDPEYNFLEEEDVLDKWDLRNDRAVKISKRELNELMAELLEAAEQELADAEEEEEVNSTASPSPFQDKSTSPTNVKSNIFTIPEFTPFDRSRLDEQMRMHVQLLTQEFLLTKDDQYSKVAARTAYELLEELYKLGTRRFNQNSKSAFFAHNLKGSLNLVSRTNFIIHLANKMPTEMPKSSRKGTNINPDVKKIIANSRVFIYPELLPQCGLQLSLEKSKVTFTQAEDHLIALGLEQFQPLQDTNCIHLIRTLMVPCKTDRQIRFRIKNVKSAQYTKENPIKYYFKHNKAPPVTQTVKPFNPDAMLPPCEQPMETLPEWMRPLVHKQHSAIIAPSPIVVPGSSQNIHTSPVYVNLTSTAIVSLKSKRKYNPILPRPVASFNVPRTGQKHVSPLKQIVPILKKYSHQRKVLPRVPVSPVKKVGNDKKSQTQRKLAMKQIPNKCEAPKNVSSQRTDIPKLALNNTLNVNSKDKKILPAPEVIIDSATSGNGAEINEKLLDDRNSEQKNANIRKNSEEPEKTIGSHSDIDINEENGEVEAEDEVIDDESDLAALMAASTTICKKQQPLMKKKNKQQKELESTLALLAPDLLESDPKKGERESMFVQSYLLKVKETLKNDIDTYETFLKTLCDFEKSNKTPTQLYENISMILHNHPALVEDFVGFLLPEQARDCGKMAEYFTLNKIRMFLRKLEVHFSHQPQHIQRILKTLCQLQWQKNLNSTIIRAALQPLLRGQTHLLEEFLQLLPNESPPESFMTDFEEITIPESEEDYSNESTEEIIIPEEDNKYGGKQCPCLCHSETTDLRMQNRVRHCIQCGIRFLGGRIYIQTGKVLKPAQVIFHAQETKKKVRLNGIQNNCHSPTHQNCDSPSSNHSLSPVAVGNNAEEDLPDECEINIAFPLDKEIGKHKNICHNQEKQNIIVEYIPSNKISEEKAHVADPFLGVLEDFSPNTATASTLLVPSHVVIEDAILPPETNQQCTIPSDFSTLRDVIKLNIDKANIIEQVCNKTTIICSAPKSTDCADKNSLKVISQIDSQIPVVSKHSSVNEKDVVTAECPDTGLSLMEQTNPGPGIKWTREEDSLLLKTCQKYGASKDTFISVAKQLKNKEHYQVSNRFQELMKLFTIEKEIDSDT